MTPSACLSATSSTPAAGNNAYATKWLNWSVPEVEALDLQQVTELWTQYGNTAVCRA